MAGLKIPVVLLLRQVASRLRFRRQKNVCLPALLRLDCAMDLEVESQIMCPYCGAVFTTVVDTSSGAFSTIEDCEVCCRPIAVNVHCHYGEIESVEIDRA
jgi:hypothetical protein